MAMALVVSRRATCHRRRVGCVLTNARGHVLATGYNGVASGMMHCIEAPCPGALMPSGSGLDSCLSIHAEMNSLMQCSDPWAIEDVYCTTSPCVHCIKMLMNTSAKTIWFYEEYPHAESKNLWLMSGIGREWHKLGGNFLRSLEKTLSNDTMFRDLKVTYAYGDSSA